MWDDEKQRARIAAEYMVNAWSKQINMHVSITDEINRTICAVGT